jgi:hypothetical protein
MRAVVYTLFPHQGKFIIVDQLAFFNYYSHTRNIPFISKTPPDYENVRVGLLKDSTLMGTFPILPPDIPPPFVTSINMISTFVSKTHKSYNPWIVLSSGDYLRYNNRMPLSPIELTYQAIQSTNPSPPSLCDTYPNLFHIIFPIDEIIMKVMSMEDTPWDDGHNHSILFLEPETIESYQRISTLSTIVIISFVPEPKHDVFYEGNLGNISLAIPLDISIKPRVMENVHISALCSVDEVRMYKSLFQEFCDVFSWSYEEMSSIDPDIVVHNIKTYPNAKPV